jgi:hypothetical protein
MAFAEMIDNFKITFSGLYTLVSSLTVGVFLFIYLFIIHIPLAIWGGLLSYNYFYKCNSVKFWLEFEKGMYDWFLKENYEVQKTIIYKILAYIILYAILFLYKIANFVLFMIVFVFTLFIPYIFLLYYFLFVYLQNKCSMEGLGSFEKTTGIDIDNSGAIGGPDLKSNNPCIKECSKTLKDTCNKDTTNKKKDCDKTCKDAHKLATKDDNIFTYNKEANDNLSKCKKSCDEQEKVLKNTCKSNFDICSNKCTDPEEELSEALIKQDYKNEYAEDLQQSAERAWDTTEQNAINARVRAENAGNSLVSSTTEAEKSNRTGFLAMLGGY